MVQQLQQPAVPAYPTALRGWADELEGKRALEAQVASDVPKVDYHDTFIADEDLISFRTFAIDLKVGEQLIRQILIDAK
ncbi:phage antirepressor KilAC domain-containing protein [Enteractinococcus helveticum]|uniref:Antirepressor protein C-terminal domain-containing protein n=1 Tax=Enteractinococcus helveticum TaxID=1837282 RepID=A0A1B7LXP6_9MICC|nr:phage antirepressor KilAC domain-containing protein [Enteractinococcus helveticum]OAV59956.1 hypothetical protein A6F49_14540 [Enteractinococcus helveticum]